MWRFFSNLGASTSWNPLGQSGPVQGCFTFTFHPLLWKLWRRQGALSGNGRKEESLYLGPLALSPVNIPTEISKLEFWRISELDMNFF
jgi:hypothetical protein